MAFFNYTPPLYLICWPITKLCRRNQKRSIGDVSTEENKPSATILPYTRIGDDDVWRKPSPAGTITAWSGYAGIRADRLLSGSGRNSRHRVSGAGYSAWPQRGIAVAVGGSLPSSLHTFA